MTDSRIESLFEWAWYVGVVVLVVSVVFVFAIGPDAPDPLPFHCEGARYLEVDGTLIVQEAGVTRRVHGAELERATVCGWYGP
jgi:hypothetical protein